MMEADFKKMTDEREGGEIRAGSYLVGEVQVSYADLVKAFGQPTYDALNDPDNRESKVSTEFVFVKRSFAGMLSDHEVVTTVFTLYDWKATSLYGGKGFPTVEEWREGTGAAKGERANWHIGGHVGGEELERFLLFLDKAISTISPFPAYAKSEDGPVDGPYPYHD
jgi:hypothetical protein